jgi:hypothetical protein
VHSDFYLAQKQLLPGPTELPGSGGAAAASSGGNNGSSSTSSTVCCTHPELVVRCGHTHSHNHKKGRVRRSHLVPLPLLTLYNRRVTIALCT